MTRILLRSDGQLLDGRGGGEDFDSLISLGCNLDLSKL